jgi:hypothetical protein
MENVWMNGVKPMNNTDKEYKMKTKKPFEANKIREKKKNQNRNQFMLLNGTVFQVRNESQNRIQENLIWGNGRFIT